MRKPQVFTQDQLCVSDFIADPYPTLPRRMTREVELSGVSIPADAPVSIFYGAANRDPETFAEPDEFRLDRDLRHHVGFGSGIHYCLGAPLARAEANLTLNTLLDRFATLKRGAAPPAARPRPSPSTASTNCR